MKCRSHREEQAIIWDYFKPRHTHAWNMLVLSWRALEHLEDEAELGFEIEYLWENFILRLWLYRVSVKTLTNLVVVKEEVQNALLSFDEAFDTSGRNGLKALRDMIEHFDDYAAGKGRGPARREIDLDPWRKVGQNRYERGEYFMERSKSFNAAIDLRSKAKELSMKFIDWYKNSAN